MTQFFEEVEEDGAEIDARAPSARAEAPLNCFPTRGEWERHNPPALLEFPAHEVSSREEAPAAFVMPRSVLSLAEYARELSWDVITQYSRGYEPHARTGVPSAEPKEVIGVRFGRHPMTQRQACATYKRTAYRGTWAWDTIWVWGPGLAMFGGLGIENLKYFLTNADKPDEYISTWIEHVKVGLAAVASVKKAAPRKAASKRREGMS